jgi:8-oxo-dGTP diphosphatase
MSYTYEYPRPAVAVDIVAFDCSGLTNDRSILLIKRGHEPYKGCWALPGGHVEPNEDLVDAAVREFGEECGIKVSATDLRQLGAYGTPGRDPRGDNVSIAFVTNLGHKVKPLAGDDAADAYWFPVDALPHLAFDHYRVIDDALKDRRF